MPLVCDTVFCYNTFSMKRLSKLLRLFIALLFIPLLPAIALSCEKKDTTEPEEPTFASLTFMTYNIRYNGDGGNLSVINRIPRIVDRIIEYSPDVFGAQEAQPYHVVSLKESFSNVYTAVYCYRDALGLFNAPESCPIFFKTEKFDLIDSGHFWLSLTPDVESRMPGAGHNRICTWVRLREKEFGREFYYYNTHLDFGEAQDKSVPVLLSRVQKDATVVLGGDFNMNPTEPNYAAVSAELTDSRVTVGTDATIGTFHDYGPPEDRIDRHIDFLFYRGDIFPTVHKVIADDEEVWGEGNFASDHYPVLVVFDLKKIG